MRGRKTPQFQLSNLQDQLARYITVKEDLTFSTVAALPLRDGGLPFGPLRGDFYKYVQKTVIESLRKSYSTFQKPSSSCPRSEWKPLSQDYNPADWLKPNPLLQPLTKEEYTRQSVKPTTATKTMPPKSKPTSSSSSASKGSGMAATIVRTDGDAGHAYIVGTLEDFARMEVSVATELYDEAKPLIFGQNESMMRMWVEHLLSVKIETNDANTEAIALTLWNVSLSQYKLYKLAYGGPNSGHLLLQVPAITDDVGDCFADTLATLQVKTTGATERERNDKYAKTRNLLLQEKTRVYCFKAPGDLTLTNKYFQDDKSLKYEGDLTTRRTLVTYVRQDKMAPKNVERAVEDLQKSSSWSDADIAQLFSNHRMSVSWQIPVDCELDRIHDELSGSDGEDDFLKDMTERMAAINDIKTNLTPTRAKKSGTDAIKFNTQMHDTIAGILFSSADKPSFQAPSFQASNASPASYYNFMHTATSEDDLFSVEEESLTHSRKTDEDEVDALIESAKMDYEHLCADALHAEAVLTAGERKQNAAAARSTAGNLAHQVESQAGFHTAATHPPAQCQHTPYAPYPPLVFGMPVVQVPPAAAYVQPPPVVYHVQTTNVNVQLNNNITNNVVNQNTCVSNMLNHNTINQVGISEAIYNVEKQVNVSNVRNTMNQMNNSYNARDAKSPVATKTPYINAGVAAESSISAASPSPRKSDIRFCPKEGHDRDLPKNAKSNVGKMKEVVKSAIRSQNSWIKFMKSTKKKKKNIVARRYKQQHINGQQQAPINGQQQAPTSRRMRSEQAEDGQSKYTKVDDTHV